MSKTHLIGEEPPHVARILKGRQSQGWIVSLIAQYWPQFTPVFPSIFLN